MQKEFVTYEIALKLKQMGFDLPCLSCYTSKTNDMNFAQWWYSDQIWDNSDLHPNPRLCKNSDFGNEMSCTAPLWQQANDWFREKYNFDIWVYKEYDDIDDITSYRFNFKTGDYVSSFYETFEEAREKSILKALKQSWLKNL